MKRVLVLYGPVSQKHLINSIIENVNDSEIELTGFNVHDWTFNDSSHMIPVIARPFLFLRSIPVLGRWVGDFLMKKLSKNYDAIDVTFFTKEYYALLDSCIRNHKPYKITIWGSDFYKSTPKDLAHKEFYYKNSDIIQVETPSVKDDVVRVYPCLAEKIIPCNYGIDLFDIIDNIRNQEDNFVLPLTQDRLVVTCGYNGSPAQQHLKMIELISELPDSIKNRLFLFMPMTYGIPSEDYLNDVKVKLDLSSVPYHIFTKRLSDIDLAKLRLQTDIVINIQVSDSFSSSLAEHLYAGNVLVAGDWLPYSFLEKKSILFYRESLEKMRDCILRLVESIDEEKRKCNNNIAILERMSSWKCVSLNLKKLFKKLVP